MKPITIRNEHGETIDIKFDADGVIKIRHSDIDPKAWGELQEYSKRLRQPAVKSFMEEKGFPPSPELNEAMAVMGGYVVIRGKSYIVDAKEVALIYATVKQAGGIVPNWSSAS